MALADKTVFGPNNGRFLGTFGLVVTAGAAGVLLADGLAGADLRLLSIAALVAVLLWCLLLRPRLVVQDSVLRLRNAFTEVVIPLVQVDHVTVTMFTQVVTPEKTYRSAAISRPRKEVMRQGTAMPDPRNSLPDLVVSRINQLADDAKAQNLSGGEIYTRPAYIELALLGALAVLSVVLFLL